MKHLPILATGILFVCSCGSKPPTSLVIENLDQPEAILARYMAADPEVVDIIGCFESHSRVKSQTMASSGGLLRPWYSRNARAGTLRLVGSDGEADINYSISSGGDQRWKIDVLELAPNQPNPVDP